MAADYASCGYGEPASEDLAQVPQDIANRWSCWRGSCGASPPITCGGRRNAASLPAPSRRTLTSACTSPFGTTSTSTARRSSTRGSSRTAGSASSGRARPSGRGPPRGSCGTTPRPESRRWKSFRAAAAPRWWRRCSSPSRTFSRPTHLSTRARTAASTSRAASPATTATGRLWWRPSTAASPRSTAIITRRRRRSTRWSTSS
mmetsp:Transcript_26179/g.75906  ORF Transcript_26179/g.75906 Transcript_26179/m.75906 type:complete len:203 (+) Transcript_26179:285-893(+)